MKQCGNIAWKIMKSYNESLLIKVLWTWCKIQTPIPSFTTLQNLVYTNLFHLKSYYSPYLSHCSPVLLETQVVSLLPQNILTSHYHFQEHETPTLYSWMIPCHYLGFGIDRYYLLSKVFPIRPIILLFFVPALRGHKSQTGLTDWAHTHTSGLCFPHIALAIYCIKSF